MSPLSLITYDQFMDPSPRDATQPVYQRVRARIHDAAQPMPPRGSLYELSAAELATLDAWLERDAPKSSESCAVVPEDLGPGPSIDRSECEFEVELRAHGGSTADDVTPFNVPPGTDIYECFNFEIPWDSPAHGLMFEPLIDNPSVLHHWTLSTVEEKLPSDTRSGPCVSPEKRSSVAGWAPGAVTTVLPPEVGIHIADGTTSTFQFEIHYNNAGASQDAQDRSGVRICATSKLRQNEAVPVVLGGLCFGPLCSGLPPGRSVVTNTCLNLSTTGPAHVLWTSPHMHKLGRHLKTEITRTDGTVETLTDRDYDYNDQRDYPSDKLIYAGDALTTTCTFENDTNKAVNFGETTQDEMCFNFLMVYPRGSISTIENFCIGL